MWGTLVEAHIRGGLCVCVCVWIFSLDHLCMAVPTSETQLFTGQNVLIARTSARSLCNMISLSLSPSLSTFKVHTSSFFWFSIQFSFTYQTGPPNFSSSVVQTANPVCVCAVLWFLKSHVPFWLVLWRRKSKIKESLV